MHCLTLGSYDVGILDLKNTAEAMRTEYSYLSYGVASDQTTLRAAISKKLALDDMESKRLNVEVLSLQEKLMNVDSSNASAFREMKAQVENLLSTNQRGKVIPYRKKLPIQENSTLKHAHKYHTRRRQKEGCALRSQASARTWSGWKESMYRHQLAARSCSESATGGLENVCLLSTIPPPCYELLLSELLYLTPSHAHDPPKRRRHIIFPPRTLFSNPDIAAKFVY